MRYAKLKALGVGLGLVVCGACYTPASTPANPNAWRPIGLHVCVPNVQVQVSGAWNENDPQVTTNGSGDVGFNVSSLSDQFNLTLTAPGYAPYAVVVAYKPVLLAEGCGIIDDPINESRIPALTPLLPVAPSRDALLNAPGCFQGITVNTSQFGSLPMFDPALESFTAGDRQITYKVWHDAGCQMVDLSVDWEYGESGQPYGTGQVVPPTLGYDLPRIRRLLTEVIQNGFYVHLHLNGDGQTGATGPDNLGYEGLMGQLPGVVNMVRQAPDLTPYVVLVPGFDGIVSYDEGCQCFGPWSMQQVATFLVTLRGLNPTGYIGIEPAIGPLGGTLPRFLQDPNLTGYGLGDNRPYDAVDEILNEFPPDQAGQHSDFSWQIADRLLGPMFVRPGDMPAGDDPNCPPCAWTAATATSRGPIVGRAFEYWTYGWVRGWLDSAAVNVTRAYYRAMGYRSIS